MTPALATLTLTPPTRGAQALPVAAARDSKVDAPQAIAARPAPARAQAGDPSQALAPRPDAASAAPGLQDAEAVAARSPDPTPASAVSQADPSRCAFADVIARLASGAAPAPAATDKVGAREDDEEHHAASDASVDAFCSALAAVATLPAVQAALQRPALAGGSGASTEGAEGRGRMADPTATALARRAPASASDLVGAGATTTDASGAIAQPRHAPGDTPAAFALRASDADDASAAAPGAGVSVPSTSQALAGAVVPDLASLARAPGADVLALRGAEPAQWRPALKAALGDRLQVQVSARSEQAVIRLDPPSLGRIEIVIRHEGGQLQVHLAASNGDVLQQLHTLTEGLRQDLVHRHHGEVAVTVSDLAREGGSQARREREGEEGSERRPGRGLGESASETGQESFAQAQDRE
jgi:flagellar hook-length control protein FliK